MPHLTRRSAALGAFILGAASPLLAAAKPARDDEAITFEPAVFKLRDGTDLPVEKGTLHVPELRGDPDSRRIPIRFLRFKSTSPRPGAPIVYLAGGPGGSGVDTARGPRQPLFLALRAVADVIALDQRGTGLSNSLRAVAAEAPFDRSVTLSEANDTAYYRGAVARALPIWKAAGMNIDGYTSNESADDLEALRRGLGVPRLNLWSISYGTHLALAAMRRHPYAFSRVAMCSVEGLDQTVKRPARLDLAMQRICAASGDPALADTIRRVHAAFDAEPREMSTPGPDGDPIRFVADSYPLRVLAGSIPKNPGGIPRLARLYAALDRGDYSPVAPTIHAAFLGLPLTVGMSDAMDIASGITDARLAQVDAEAPGSFLGRVTNMPMPQLRYAIPGIDLGDAYRRESTSSIPTLVFSGGLDIRTPREEQAEAVAGLSHRQMIAIPNGGHDLYEAHPDMAGILAAFFSGARVTQRELMLPG
jgi:pimeloyl-ACP methyl ester carboxylesterase